MANEAGDNLLREFRDLHHAARGCEFDLTPADGPIGRLTLFVHENGDRLIEALAVPPTPAIDQAGADRARIERAIKSTEYKYFGDYEMSDDQREAVDTLVEVARNALTKPTEPASEGVRRAARDRQMYQQGRFDALNDEPEAFI